MTTDEERRAAAEITQADRDVYAQVMRELGCAEWMAADVAAGCDDDDAAMHLVATHRTQAFAAGRLAGLEEAAKACEDQRTAFLSPQYATGQPVSSISERFACTECANAIRNLKDKANG